MYIEYTYTCDLSINMIQIVLKQRHIRLSLPRSQDANLNRRWRDRGTVPCTTTSLSGSGEESSAETGQRFCQGGRHNWVTTYDGSKELKDLWSKWTIGSQCVRLFSFFFRSSLSLSLSPCVSHLSWRNLYSKHLTVVTNHLSLVFSCFFHVISCSSRSSKEVLHVELFQLCEKYGAQGNPKNEVTPAPTKS